MSTLANRPNAALLVVDVQVGVVARSYETKAAVANIKCAVEISIGKNHRAPGCKTGVVKAAELDFGA